MDSKGYGTNAMVFSKKPNLVKCGRAGADGTRHCSGKLGYLIDDDEHIWFRPYGEPFPLCAWRMTQDRYGRIIKLTPRGLQSYNRGKLPAARTPMDIDYYKRLLRAGATDVQANDMYKPVRVVCPECDMINYVDPQEVAVKRAQAVERLQAKERERIIRAVAERRKQQAD